MDHVRTWLAQEIEQTDQGFPANTQVSFRNERLVIQKTTPKESKGAAQLKKLIEDRIRPVNLIDVLVDTELWLTWTRHFKPVSGYEAKLEDPVA